MEKVLISPAGARLRVLGKAEMPYGTGLYVLVLSAPPESRFQVGTRERLYLPPAALSHPEGE